MKIFRSRQESKWQHGVVTQIPRNSLIMLLATFVMVIIPHAKQVSFWIIAAGLFCVIWRWMIFLGRKSFLSFWQKAVLVLISTAGIIITEGIQQNLETWAALLIMAFALKLLEMKTQRDAYVVIFIAYFVIAIEFIFNNSMLIVAYELCVLILVTASMVGMNQLHTHVKPYESLKVASKLLAQAIPLMVVLFILFPRIGPIWAISSPSQQARTGLGSEMTPGDITKLARSDEIAFRAIFKEEPPSTSKLYWRGRVYTDFYKGKWSEATIPPKFNNIPKISWANNKNKAWFIPNELGDSNSKFSYSILFEPTNSQHLIGIDLAIPITQSMGLTWDYKLINKHPVHSILQYDVDSYPNATLNTWLPEFIRIQTTQFDKNDNPKIIEFAQNLYAESSDHESFIDNLLKHIRDEAYHYTLEPPQLERENSIDQFWFNTRQGFCTHYAGAMVYMLRSVGIPARMVGGYQGGEINPITGHVVVRQYLAHAWVEYWIANQGWQRIDPTAAVAPSRIHESLSAALSENDLGSLSAFTNARLNGVPGMQKIMFFLESIEHRWNLFIIGYNSELQTDFLQKLFGNITTIKIAFVLLLGALLSVVIVIIPLIFTNRAKHQHPVIKLYLEFASKLCKKGFKRNFEETPAKFIEHVSKQINLSKAEYSPVIDMINSLLYDPSQKCSKQNLDVLKAELNYLNRKIQAIS